MAAVAIAIAAAICLSSGLSIDNLVSSEVWLEYLAVSAIESMSCSYLDFDDCFYW